MQIYGPYTSSQWIPKAYADNKGRYLWTDAFGVCNYITFFRLVNDQLKPCKEQYKSVLQKVYPFVSACLSGFARS